MLHIGSCLLDVILLRCPEKPTESETKWSLLFLSLSNMVDNNIRTHYIFLHGQYNCIIRNLKRTKKEENAAHLIQMQLY